MNTAFDDIKDGVDDLVRQNFQRDFAVEAGVESGEDFTHAAFAKQRLDLERT